MCKFFDSKDEKLTEKAFSQSLIISIISILLCVVALCSMTFAWFIGEAKISDNVIVSGSFDLVITVTKDGTELPIEADPDKEGVLICNISEGGTYTVILKLKEGSSVKGHCLVKVGNDEYRHTDAIFKRNSSESDSAQNFTFTVTVSGGTAIVFEPRWGMVVEPDIENGGAYPSVNNAGEENS